MHSLIGCTLSYGTQLSQLVVLQPEQEAPPIDEVWPVSSREKQAKLDTTRFA